MLSALAVIRSFFFWGIVAPLLAGLGREVQIVLFFLVAYTLILSALYALEQSLVTWEPIGAWGTSEQARGLVAFGAILLAAFMLYRFNDISLPEMFTTNQRFIIPWIVLCGRVIGGIFAQAHRTATG